jgi:hypothetical protein
LQEIEIPKNIYTIAKLAGFGLDSELKFYATLLELLIGVDAPASPALFLLGTKQEKEVAHSDIRKVLCHSGTGI